MALPVYRAYWRAVGWGLALAILFALLLMQGRSKPRSPLSHLQPCHLGPHHIHYKGQRLTRHGQQLGQRRAPNSKGVPGPEGCTL